MRDYGMSLAAIERSYGCVAEYNRCMEEENDYEYEQEARRRKYYAENKKKLEDASKNDNLQYFCEDCVGCKDYVSIGPKCEDDDVEHGICNGSKTCKYREEVRQQCIYDVNQSMLLKAAREGKMLVCSDNCFSCDNYECIGATSARSKVEGICHKNGHCIHQDELPFN